MAKKKQITGGVDDGKGNGNGSGGLGRVQWFNPSPNSTDKAWLDANDDKLVELALSLLEAIPEVGRLTVKYDVGTSRWLAILFVGGSSEEYEFDALSVRGSTAFDAVILVSYFHYIKFEEAWVGDPDKHTGRWG